MKYTVFLVFLVVPLFAMKRSLEWDIAEWKAARREVEKTVREVKKLEQEKQARARLKESARGENIKGKDIS